MQHDAFSGTPAKPVKGKDDKCKYEGKKLQTAVYCRQ